MPVINAAGAEDISDLVANDGLPMIADEFQGSTSLNDVNLSGIDKFFICLDAIHIRYSDKDYSSSRTIMDSRYI
jgi:hypothetical protein